MHLWKIWQKTSRLRCKRDTPRAAEKAQLNVEAGEEQENAGETSTRDARVD